MEYFVKNNEDNEEVQQRFTQSGNRNYIVDSLMNQQHNCFNWKTLPLEVKLYLFSLIPVDDLVENGRLVCKEWAEIISISPTFTGDDKNLHFNLHLKLLWLPIASKLFLNLKIPQTILPMYLSIYIANSHDQIWKFIYKSFLFSQKSRSSKEMIKKQKTDSSSSSSPSSASSISIHKDPHSMMSRFKSTLSKSCSNLKKKTNRLTRKLSLDQDRFSTISKKKNSTFCITLLGAGDVGKSTVFKQVKILENENSFSTDYRETFIYCAHTSIITQMRALIDACAKLKIELEPQNKACAVRIQNVHLRYRDLYPNDDRIISDLQSLWKDKGIQQAFEQREVAFQLNCTARYFFDDLERISASNYVPTIDDLLHDRVRTTGIDLTKFQFSQGVITVMDTGGERSERRKWIHAIISQSPQLIIFCVSLLEYIQTLREDSTQNRMHESLHLFKTCVGSSLLTNFVILFTKVDLFIENLKKYPISRCFPEYKGDNSFSSAFSFIRQKFLECDTENKVLCTYPICTTNTFNFSLVWDHVVKLF